MELSIDRKLHVEDFDSDFGFSVWITNPKQIERITAMAEAQGLHVSEMAPLHRLPELSYCEAFVRLMA